MFFLKSRLQTLSLLVSPGSGPGFVPSLRKSLLVVYTKVPSSF